MTDIDDLRRGLKKLGRKSRRADKFCDLMIPAIVGFWWPGDIGRLGHYVVWNPKTRLFVDPSLPPAVTVDFVNKRLQRGGEILAVYH